MKERRDDAAAQDAQGKADMKAGIAEARGVAKAARATPAGQFERHAGGAVAASEVENTVGAMLNTGKAGASRMRGLVDSVQPDPKGAPTPELQGLRKAAVDFMLRKFANADGSIGSAAMLKFLTNNRDVLAELFPHEQRVMFGALARDAENEAAWRNATKIKAGSDTAQNLKAMIGKAKEAAPYGSLAFVALDAIKDMVMEGHVSPLLVGSAVGGYLANGLRAAGIKKRTDLVRAAMLDPQLARVLISKAPTATNMRPAHVLVGALRRATILSNTLGPKPAQPSIRPPAASVERRGGLLSDFMVR